MQNNKLKLVIQFGLSVIACCILLAACDLCKKPELEEI